MIKRISIILICLMATPMAILAQNTWDGGSSIPSFTSNGNVGIGTTSPGSALTIKRLTSSFMHLQYDDGGTYPRLYLEATSTGFSWRTHYGSSPIDLNFATPYTAHALVVKPSGNIGIGTNTPGYRLDICGTARAKEVIVETGWCDFVFADDYHLRPLSEVEAYIDEHHHLPEIPPASEVEDNGLKLAEMNKKMMLKIEELTLYVIELQKELDTLKEEVKN